MPQAVACRKPVGSQDLFYGTWPSYLFNALLSHFSKRPVCFCANTNGNRMACGLQCGPLFLVLSLGVVGRDTAGMLAP
jgi:hypothetical protein